MFSGSSNRNYDMSTNVYSPEGRIIQTEYAREAMRKGRIAIGLRSKTAIVLAGKIDNVDLDIPSKKISKIDNRMSSIFAGYAADGRVIIEKARYEAAIHKLTYDDQIDIKALSTEIANYMHRHTLGGIRPFGVGLLIGGVDSFDGVPRIFFLNPGGGMVETKAKAIGDGEAKAIKFIKAKNDEKAIDELNKDELIALARATIKHVIDDEKLDDAAIEIWSESV